MKRISKIALFVLASFATIHSAPAQSVRLSTTTIPFAFTVNDTTLPAGEYVVNALSIQTPNVLMIVSDKLRHPVSAIFMTVGNGKANPNNVSKLVFETYGGRYFLCEIVSPVNTTDGILPTSKQEERFRFTLAGNGGGQPVVVALSKGVAESHAVRISGE